MSNIPKQTVLNKRAVDCILNGTRNRRHWKGWEQGILYQCSIRDTLEEETKNVS